MGGSVGRALDPTSSDFLGGVPTVANPRGQQKMSGGKGAKPPAAPDFNEAARIQAESSEKVNREQTQANRPNQYNEFGSSEWTQDANGNWTQRSGLNDTLGAAAEGLQGQVLDNAGRPVMTGDAARQQAIDAGYSQATRMLDPQMAQREQAMKADLAAQGLDPSSEAYQKAVGDFDRSRTTAYGDARDRAIGQGTAAGQATFMQNLAAREVPMAELDQLKGLGKSDPFTAAGAAQPIQSLAAAMQQYGGDLQGYGIQQQGKNSKMSGGASLAPLLAG
jgi:hypothetical protein